MGSNRTKPRCKLRRPPHPHSSCQVRVEMGRAHGFVRYHSTSLFSLLTVSVARATDFARRLLVPSATLSIQERWHGVILDLTFIDSATCHCYRLILRSPPRFASNETVAEADTDILFVMPVRGRNPIARKQCVHGYDGTIYRTSIYLPGSIGYYRRHLFVILNNI